ncbi:hypothetical protein [Nitrosopumilus sp.]|uniref:hypothetical protein n=1 Tax=Nitrosopumilus sp. TaxID=2024843 RepID=UPI00292E85B0|nr:hypothetical protein [Nitrosopumilus sp.]
MTNKKMMMLPAFAAIFALMLGASGTIEYSSAEPGDGYAAHGYDNGAKKMHKNQPVQVDGFVGSIAITEDFDREVLREQVTVSLSEAADGLDVQKASLGAVINENDDKYLVWKLVNVDRDSESETVTLTIHIVDAVNAENIATVTQEFDYFMNSKQGYGQSGTQFNELRENGISFRSPV